MDRYKNMSSGEQGGHSLGPPSPINVIAKPRSRNVQFRSLTVMTSKITVFWKVTCTVIDIYQLAASIFRIIFHLEDGGNRLLQNVGKYLPWYMTLHAKNSHLRVKVFLHVLVIQIWNYFFNKKFRQLFRY
jgi:hypothetical protein